MISELTRLVGRVTSGSENGNGGGGGGADDADQIVEGDDERATERAITPLRRGTKSDERSRKLVVVTSEETSLLRLRGKFLTLVLRF